MCQESSPGERKTEAFIHWIPSPLVKRCPINPQLLCIPRCECMSKKWVPSGVLQRGIKEAPGWMKAKEPPPPSLM